MSFKTPLLATLSGVVLLAGCVDPNTSGDPNARTKNGAMIGGLVGALGGAAVSDDDKLKGALIGGALGAGAGALIGQNLDRQAAELRGSLSNPNITVTNYGDYLVVNMPQDVLFATDSAELRGTLTRDVQAVANSLVKYPNSTIQVIGHTDSTGSDAYNMDLSQRRASSVANVLSYSGVPSSRIQTIGKGKTQPIASNATEAGRAQNRRVEIIIRPYR
ncbi:OmpA family protein [Fuscibacter oryzae]|uniref:OmpA family protein n=1 Tax=Fuscibacter oryzae TaxID=2803939 RepID=A0A8J7MQJ6_9RHOB|nr:OmpA family protein [Fuscibacter oryzae]MBL4926980.1 OmpA family protein [Fuscibacter oryzae]